MNPRWTQVLEQWLGLLNRTSLDDHTLDQAIRLRYYPSGRGSEARELHGREAVLQWMQRGPQRYQYEGRAPTQATVDGSLGPADQAFGSRYTVSFTQGRWSNQGDWLFQLHHDQLVAVLHIPDALNDDEIDFDAPVSCAVDDTLAHEHSHAHEEQPSTAQSEPALQATSSLGTEHKRPG